MKIATIQLPSGIHFSVDQIRQLGATVQKQFGEGFKVVIVPAGMALNFPEEQAKAITNLAASMDRIESLLDSVIIAGRVITVQQS